MVALSPPISPAPVEEVLRRVYDGRAKLVDLFCPNWDSVRIVIAEECYAEILMSLSRGKHYGAIQSSYSVDSEKIEHKLIIFDIQVEVDARLMPHEIRFRSEVVL